MKKIHVLLLITFASVSSFSFSEDQETGFYAVEDNGNTIILTENEVAVLESDGDIYMAETSRDGYRKVSEEEAAFLKAVAEKKAQSEEY